MCARLWVFVRETERVYPILKERGFFKMPYLQPAKVSSHAKRITWVGVYGCTVWAGVYILYVCKCENENVPVLHKL